MTALIWLSLALALASLGIAGAALTLTLRQNRPPTAALPPAPIALPEHPTSPVEGLTVVLAISQDHAHPVFANMLSETLQRLDAEVSTTSPAALPEFRTEWLTHPEKADLLISGSVTCNGYSEVYYRAELTCATRSETIVTTIENPATGDRQANLAKELVSQIEMEITKRVSRTERRLALRELNTPNPPD